MLLPSQTKTNRSLGNSQSRLSAMPSSPAYGNTTNVNGAQTAVGGMSPAPSGALVGDARKAELRGLIFPQQQALQQSQQQSVMPQSPPAIYPGGDAPGISRFYRNTAIQGYLNNQMVPYSPLQSNAQSGSMMMVPYSPLQSNAQSGSMMMVPYSPLQSNAQSGSMMMDDRQQAAQMRGLAGEIDAIRERSQIANPMVPNSPAMTGFVDPQAESDRRMAPALARDAAKQQNTPANGNTAFANDPNRLTPDQKSGLARESALRAAGGGAAADPTNIGGRFGGAYGSALDKDAAAIREGRAVRTADGKVVYHTGTFESAKIAQNAGKAEREKLRDRSNMNVPKEELDRRVAADAAKRSRSERASAFQESHGGLNTKQWDRLERKRQLTEKSVSEGRITREEANARLEFAMDRAKSRAQKSSGSDQARPLAEMPNRPNLATQPPEVAKAAVQTAVTQFPVVKELGWTAESKPQDVMNSIAGMNPQQMTSTQKFEAARQIHDYMLSQVESGNPDYAIEDGIASDGSDPRIGFVGLSGLKPGDKDAMVRWFDDLNRQAKSLYGTENSRLQQMPSYLMGN